MSDRAEAQRRADGIRAFRVELEALHRAGVLELTPEQRAAVQAHHTQILRTLAAQHDVDATAASGQLSRGMRVAAFFAAMTLTAAVYSLVARFWGGLDVPLQATLLCAFPLVSLVGVELAAERERTLYVASIFAFVAYGTFWLAVATLSHLLDVPIAPPAIWAGALFGVALALPYGFRLILAAALVALLVALSSSVFYLAGVPWWATFEHLDIIVIAAFLLLPAAQFLGLLHPSFAAVTRLVGWAVAFAGMLVLSTEGRVSLLTSSAGISELIYQGLMLLVGLVGLVLGIRKQWAETVWVSAAALTLFLLVRFVDWFWAAVPRYAFFLLLAGLAFAWLAALRRLRTRLVRAEAA